ncbi:unnamed protein product [Didymodactylos carnosus]|uniref:Gag-like protein n=1 Tax=Didymodactylos carnosus TaxID=1234261 RepID=A0A814TIK7_9BILA|nr:unnamed protein product [Didymodactylos carnosus]CAF1158669.1 unnamed protein product [Didymodactylos carnosus]CAF3765437.1 unnamed protein product [Didymodactylos carnosus]CAF3922060.1 unnamed protein product [Didymodactylos carnosus]
MQNSQQQPNLNSNMPYDTETLVNYIRTNPRYALGVHQQLLENQQTQASINSASSSLALQQRPQQTSTPSSKRVLDNSSSGGRQQNKRVFHNRVLPSNNGMNTSLSNGYPSEQPAQLQRPQPQPQQQTTQEQNSRRIPFDQLKRAVSSNLPRFFIEYDDSTPHEDLPSDTMAANLLEQHFVQNGYNISFSFVAHIGNKLKVGVNNKENYAQLISADVWPDKIGNVNIKVVKPSYVPDAFAIVVRFVDCQYDEETVKTEILRNFHSAENIRKINYAFERRANDFRFNVKDLREYNSALHRGRISIGNSLCIITPFKVGNRMTFCTKCWCLGHLQNNCQATSPRCRLCLEDLAGSDNIHSCSTGPKCAQCNEDHHSLDSRCDKIKEYRAELKQEVNRALQGGRLQRFEPLESPTPTFQLRQGQLPQLPLPINSHPAPWSRANAATFIPPLTTTTTNNSTADLNQTLLKINENLLAMRNSSERIEERLGNI